MTSTEILKRISRNKLLLERLNRLGYRLDPEVIKRFLEQASK